MSSRKKKFFLNSITSLIKQLITIICSFLLSRYMLLYYGSSVNGLVASITQFLSFIAFMELGMGAVVQSSLYKPLADRDEKEISKIFVSTERFFKRIAYIFVVYVILLCVFFPMFVNKEFSTITSIILIVVISVSSFAQYYFGISYSILLNADQKAYISSIIQLVTIVSNTVVCILLMVGGFSIEFVKLATSLIYLARPIFMRYYVKKHYNIDKKIKYEKEPIKQKWNGIVQHVAAVITTNTDIAVLTIFSTLNNVSIYNVYYYVAYGISNTIMVGMTGLEATIGNMIAKNEKESLEKVFNKLELFIHFIITVVFSVAIIMVIPFVKLYTRGVNDANYIIPVFAILLLLAYAFQCLRIPYYRVIKAAGHYKETQRASIIQMTLNIVISVILVIQFGLIGVAIGTIIAMLYHTCYCARYISKKVITQYKYIKFYQHLFIDLIIGIICYFVLRLFNLESDTYLIWTLKSVAVTIGCAIIAISINFIFYCKDILNLLKAIKIKLNSRKVLK